MSAKVTFEEAKKVIEIGAVDEQLAELLSGEQYAYLAFLGAKSLASGKIQREKRAEKVRTALEYYERAKASGDVDTQ